MNTIVLPNTIKILKNAVGIAERQIHIEESEPHTDRALLSYFNAGYFGGDVTRMHDKTIVTLYSGE
jgi:hypothetical protein